jgi:hypothetical protein
MALASLKVKNDILSKSETTEFNFQVGERMKACLVKIEPDSLLSMGIDFTETDGGFHGDIRYPKAILEYYQFEKIKVKNR